MAAVGVPLPALSLLAAVWQRRLPEGRRRMQRQSWQPTAFAGEAASESTLVPQRRQLSDSVIGGGGTTSADEPIAAARQLEEERAEAAKQLNRLICGAPSASGWSGRS